MRLNKIAPRWSAPLVSAGLMLLAGTVGVTTGCGSGSAEKKPTPTPTGTVSPTPTPTGQTDGVVRVAVDWPSRTGRLIPLASQSVNVVLQDNDHKEVRTSVLAVRPAQTDANGRDNGGDDANTSTVIFSPVPPGSYSITAAAYPVAQPPGDGSSVAQAFTATPITVVVKSGETKFITLAPLLVSSITSLVIDAPSTGKSMIVGQSDTIVAIAKNAAGATVATTASSTTYPATALKTIQFASSDPAVATIDGNGVVQALAAGTTTITVTDVESGKSAQTTVTVTDPPVATL